MMMRRCVVCVLGLCASKTAATTTLMKTSQAYWLSVSVRGVCGGGG